MSIRLRLDRPHRYRRAATAAGVVAVGLGIAVLVAPRLTQSDPASGGVEGYMEHMEANFAYCERLSDRLLGRRIPQVLPLQVNEPDVDHRDALVATIGARDYAFVGLGRALGDPAYMLPDDYVGTRGLSWLQRWALTRGVEPEPEPREPAWMARLYREY